MKRYCIISGMLALISLSIFDAWPAQGAPPKVKSLIEDLRLSDRNKLWPGYSPLFKPLALHIKGVGSYLIIQSTDSKTAKEVPYRVVFIRNKPADTVVSDFSANFISPEAGNVFLYNYSGRSVSEAEMIIAHEMFHLFQQGEFKGASSVPVQVPAHKGILARYLDDLRSISDWWEQLRFAKNPDVKQSPSIRDTALAYVEDRLLSQALLDRKNYRALTAEFVRMRDYRRARLPIEVLEQEIKQERLEGTAEYVGWKSLADNYTPMLAENYQAGMLLSPQPLANQDRRYYSPGAAQGFLLDRLGVTWKQRVQNGEDVFQIMRENFVPDTHTRTVKILLKDFYSDWVKAALEAQAVELSEKKTLALEQLKKYAGWKLVLGKSMACEGQSRTCYDEPVKLPDGGYYMPACHTELRCSWGTLSVDAPVIDAPREVTVFLGDAPPFDVSTDGVNAKRVASSLVSRDFRLATDGFSMNLVIPGRIRVAGKTIFVEPTDISVSKRSD